MIYNGPKDHWQVELEKVSKAGLIDLVERLLFVFDGSGRDARLAMAQSARRTGRFLDTIRNCQSYQANPEEWLTNKINRSKAAKKAARRRKKERKAK